MKKIDILGVLVDHVNMQEALSRVLSFLDEEGAHTVFTPNSEIIMTAYQNPDFLPVLNSGDLIVADGIGVVYASRILKSPLPERVAGYDLACNIIRSVANGEKSLYFFGGKPGVAELAIQNLMMEYPYLKIAGCSDGYFDAEKEKLIIKDIQEKKPDILFVCLGAPKQENWIYDHKDELAARLILGVGGSLDVWAGTVERAPEKYQKAGLEWFYRLKKQPSRFFRMLALPPSAADQM